MLDRFQQGLQEFDLIQKGDRVIVGVSGGVDSVSLIHILSRIPELELHLAHVNYGLRGVASDKDQVLCEKLGESLSLRTHICDARSSKPESGIQEWARKLRYQFFSDLLKDLDAKKIAVAHHQDDQIETIFHNLFRGTGIKGLRGMLPKRDLENGGQLLRPFLQFSRAEILDYAKENDLDWNEDQSNLDEEKYTRSWIRGVVIPMIESRFGDGLQERVTNTASQLADFEREVYAPTLRELAEKVCLQETGQLKLDILELKKAPLFLQKSLLLDCVAKLGKSSPDSSMATRLLELVEKQKGKSLEYSSLTILNNGDHLLMQQNESIQGFHVTESLSIEKRVDTGQGILSLRIVDAKDVSPGSRDGVEFVDMKKISLPLEVRLWQNGDRIIPLGMSGSKLISDYLTDRKLDHQLRKGQVVVLYGDEIIWVPGLGISDKYKLDSDSELALRMECLQS